jgi:hypothetical protein
LDVRIHVHAHGHQLMVTDVPRVVLVMHIIYRFLGYFYEHTSIYLALGLMSSTSSHGGSLVCFFILSRAQIMRQYMIANYLNHVLSKFTFFMSPLMYILYYICLSDHKDAKRLRRANHVTTTDRSTRSNR